MRVDELEALRACVNQLQSESDEKAEDGALQVLTLLALLVQKVQILTQEGRGRRALQVFTAQYTCCISAPEEDLCWCIGRSSTRERQLHELKLLVCVRP